MGDDGSTVTAGAGVGPALAGAVWRLVCPLQRAAARARHGREKLIIFTRYPEPGRTKTRMIPLLGPEGAADLQRRMTVRIMQAAGALAARRPCEVEVRYEGGSGPAMRDWLGPDVACRPQGRGDLGERMLHAFARSFAEGFDRVVLVGSDCPRVDERVLDRAFESLSAGPAAIGPASDGGYYLIGLRRPAPQLFDSVAWGTDGVLAQTLQRARYAALDVALLDELDDVDRPEDMPVWNAAAAAEGDLTASSVSVVMPALNEERRIQASLDSVARARAAEVIVVDGGSEDRTVEIARAAGARVISCRPGRALQANAGAAAASGRILLFVHADTLLPWGYDDAARHAMADPRNVAGAFRLRLEADGAPFRLIETNINARSRVLSTPYGDQGLFVRADTFGVLGGFKPMAVMEDFEMVHRLRRLGRICVLNTPATTSARRWQQLGPLRVTVINQVMIAGYALGIQPNRLAALYGERAGRRARKKQ